MGVDGQVFNPMINKDSKINKKKDSGKINDSLMMVWPKLEGKRYALLIEERNNLHRKRSWTKKFRLSNKNSKTINE